MFQANFLFLTKNKLGEDNYKLKIQILRMILNCNTSVNMNGTVLPAKSDSDAMFCLQAIRDLYKIDHSCINPILRIGLIHK